MSSTLIEPVFSPCRVLGFLYHLFSFLASPSSILLLPVKLTLILSIVVLLIVLIVLSLPTIPASIATAITLAYHTNNAVLVTLTSIATAHRLLRFFIRTLRFRTWLSKILCVGISTAISVFLPWNQRTAIVIAVFTWISALSEFWVPASPIRLASSEQALSTLYGVEQSKKDSSCPAGSATNYRSKLERVSGISYVEFNERDDSKPTLVLIAGYAGGKIMYAILYPYLRQRFNLIGVDLFGLGASHRPFFLQYTSASALESKLVETLEIWRKQMSLEKMFLLGHSMGGYITAQYAMKYHVNLEKLILASPVGVPEKRNDLVFLPLLEVLWRFGMTAQSLLHMFGPFGPAFVKDVVEYRFGDLIPHRKELSSYIYEINAAPASGEVILFKSFLQGAYAKNPLIDRIHHIKCDVTFLYGRHDWMDVKAGRQACRIVKEQGFRSHLYIVDEAGHQVFMENPELFSKVILKDMDDAHSEGKQNESDISITSSY